VPASTAISMSEAAPAPVSGVRPGANGPAETSTISSWRPTPAVASIVSVFCTVASPQLAPSTWIAPSAVRPRRARVAVPEKSTTTFPAAAS
jgi:hypothetical protein